MKIKEIIDLEEHNYILDLIDKLINLKIIKDGTDSILFNNSKKIKIKKYIIEYAVYGTREYGQRIIDIRDISNDFSYGTADYSDRRIPEEVLEELLNYDVSSIEDIE